MAGEQKLDQAFLDQVKKRMTELVEQKIPVKKRSVGTDEAIALFHHHRMYDKEKLFRYRRVSRVNIYSIENFEDYFYGAMAYDTGYVPYFDLKLYDEGFVLILPDAKAPDVLPEFQPQEKIFQVQKDSEEWGRKLEISTVGELNDQIVSQGYRRSFLCRRQSRSLNCQNCRADRGGWKQEVRHDRWSVLLRQDYLFPQAVHSAGGTWNEATSHCC